MAAEEVNASDNNGDKHDAKDSLANPLPASSHPPDQESGDLVAESEITQAKTVVRGSSRVSQEISEFNPRQGSPASVAKVLLGQHLNHFFLEKLIGGGGMGAVFRARDEQLDRIVAIKVIPFVANDPDLRRRFRNEAQSAAKLDHPKIARVFDVGSQGDWHYIVFEYISGINVRDLVSRQGVLSVDEAVFYSCQLAEALQHASDRGIVHRDVKPSNILIVSDDGVRLVDMGLARSASLDLSEDMTASGVTLGTFDYISPEQAKDPRDADLRSDLYSLGCTLVFMLTGGPPFPGGTMLQKLLSHGNTPPPDIRSARPDVSDNLKAVIEKMLAKRPANRYQTAHDLIADLQEVASRDNLKKTKGLSPSLVIESRPWLIAIERHLPWMVAVLLMLIVAGWLQLQSYAYRADVRTPSSDAVIDPAGTQPSGSLLSQVRPEEEGGVEGAMLSAGPIEPDFLPLASVGTGLSEIGNELEQVNGSELSMNPEGQNTNNGIVATQDADFQSVQGKDSDSLGDPQSSESDPPVSLEMNRPVGEFSGGVAVAEVTVVRVVGDVADSQESTDPEVVLTDGLSSAIKIARRYPTTTRIELAVPSVVCTDPITLESDDLLITSTVGGTAIVFKPKDSFLMARSRMFAIGSHPVVFEDLHFVWDVDEDDLDGGCLFQLHPNELVRFTDCSITVRNSGMVDEVYAFEVVTDPGALSRRNDSPKDKLPLVWLEMNNAIIRGQMTMLHMDFATRLWLDWDNGLLAVSDRMIDTAGALYPPDQGSDLIRMKLWRVTAHTPKGVFLMRVGVSGAYPIEVDRLAHECVFWVGSGIPHYDLRGMPSVRAGTPIALQGASNIYVTDTMQSDPMLRLLTSADDRKEVLMEEIAKREVTWAADKSSKWLVNWAFEGLEAVPFDRRSAVNYRQVGENPPGFDEKALPLPPERLEFEGNAVRAALSN